MRPDGIKITKEHAAELGVGRGDVGNHSFAHEFCPAVGIGAAERRILRQRHGVVRTVNSGGRGEHKALDAVRGHGLEQRYRSADVVFIIFQRQPGTFANRFAAGEVDDGIYWIGCKHPVQRVAVTNVQPETREVRAA